MPRLWMGRTYNEADRLNSRYGLAAASQFQADYSVPGEIIPLHSPPITTPIDCTLAEIVVTIRVGGPAFGVAVNRGSDLAWGATLPPDTNLQVYAVNSIYGASTADTSLWVVQFLDASTAEDCNVSLRFNP